MMDQRKNRFSQIIRQYIITFGVLIILLLGVEGLLRLEKGLRRIDDIPYIVVNGLTVFTPNVDTIVTGGAFTPIHVKTNKEGFASPDYPLVASSSINRIIFLGNSFTRGFDVDYNKKFTSLVEQWMNEISVASSTKFQVMNYAIGGYSFIDQLVVYYRYVRKYHPEVVLLVVYPPWDFHTNQNFLAQKDIILKAKLDELNASTTLLQKETASYLPSSASTANAISNWELFRFGRRIAAAIGERLYGVTLNKSALISRPASIFYRLGVRLHLLSAQQRIGADSVNTADNLPYFNPEDAKEAAIMRYSGALAEKLARAVEDDGGQFGLVIIPSYWQVDAKYRNQLLAGDSSSLDFSLPSRILTTPLAGRYQVLDLAPSFDNAINIDHTQLFVRDVGHLTGQGHDLTAREIVKFLQTKFKF